MEDLKQKNSDKKKDFKQFQEELGIHFNNENLLIQAFTHSSYVNEHRKQSLQDNERLEFLGDAVLDLAVSKFLYENFQDVAEGDLTKIRAAVVCEASLASFANQLNFGDYILLGKGEERTNGRKRAALLADVYEAFISALYLDQSMTAVRDFLAKTVFQKIINGDFSQLIDYKSQLQEIVQKEKNKAISYRVVSEEGPAHNRVFISNVLINGVVIGTGQGKSKKIAEQIAASIALKKLK